MEGGDGRQAARGLWEKQCAWNLCAHTQPIAQRKSQARKNKAFANPTELVVY